MFIATNQMKVKLGKGELLESKFKEFYSLEEVPGFLSFQLLKRVWTPHGGGNYEEYIAYAEWASQQAFLDWVRSDQFKQAHKNPQTEIFVEPPHPSGYTIVAELEK